MSDSSLNIKTPHTVAEGMKSALAFLLEFRSTLAHAGDDASDYYRIVGALQNGTAAPSQVHGYLTDRETRRRIDSSGAGTNWWGSIVVALLSEEDADVIAKSSLRTPK